MLEILSTYTIAQLIIILVGVGLLVKGIWDLVDFFANKIKKHYDKNQEGEITRKEILEQIEKVSEKLNKLSDDQQTIKEKIEEQQDFLDLLMDSDKDQLKSLIVNRYHHFIAQGWIDDFSMDSLEKCFQHYQDEGGNSYIHDLMNDLRRLPHTPQKNN